MKIQSLQVKDVLHFKDKQLTFPTENPGLHVIYGVNEAGKSTLLQVFIDFLFGEAKGNLYTVNSEINGVIESNLLERPLPVQRKLQRTKKSADPALDQAMAPLLRGFTKEQYKMIYGLDHDRLREGGDALLASSGELGITLFEASGGIQSLQRVLEALKATSEMTLDPSFRLKSNKYINSTYSKWSELLNSIDKNALPSAEWNQLDQSIKKLETEDASIAAELKQLMLELQKWERVKRLSQPYANYRDALAHTQSLKPESPILDEDLATLDLAFQKREELHKSIAELNLQSEELEKQLQNTAPDEQMLEQAALIEKINKEFRQHLKREETELPDLIAQQKQQEALVERLREQLFPGQATQAQLYVRIPLNFVDWIKEHVPKWKTIQDAIDKLKRDLFAEMQQMTKTEAELATFETLADWSLFDWHLNQMNPDIYLDKRIRELQAQIEKKMREIDAIWIKQTVSRANCEQIVMKAMPMLATIRQYEKDFTANETEQKQLERLIQDETELQHAERQKIDSLNRRESIPSDEDLFAAREERTQKWGEVRASWESSVRTENMNALASAYERTVEEVDSLADRMRKGADILAQRDQWQRNLQESERKSEQLRAKWDENTRAYEQLKQKWLVEWNGLDVQVLSPNEMEHWVEQTVQPIQKERKQIADWVAECNALQKTRENHIKKLEPYFAQMKDYPDFQKIDFEQGFQWCKQQFKAHEQKLREKEILLTRFHDAKERKQLIELQINHETQLIHDIEKEWATIREQNSHLPAQFSVASHFVEQWMQMIDAHEHALQAAIQIGKLKAESKQFADQLATLINALKLDARTFENVEQDVETLYARFNQTRELDAKRKLLLTNQASLQQKMASVQSERQTNLQFLNEKCSAYPCADLEMFFGLLQQTNAWKRSRAQLNQMIQHMIDVGDERTFEELEAEQLAVTNPAMIATEIARLEMTIASQNARQSALLTKLGGQRSEFARINVDRADAAQFSLQAETKLSELDRHIDHWIQAELAKRMLEKAIHQRREAQESSILEYASQYFRRLTNQQYKGLVVKIDDAQQAFFEGEYHDGTLRGLSLMSDGTRDQMYLALRLAFIAKQSEERSPLPLIIDDIMVHFDDQRTLATLEILSELSDRIQIIYFTHHERIAIDTEKLAKADSITVHRLDPRIRTSV